MARPATLEPNRTAAFTLTDRAIAWIHEQAEKRAISKSAVVREIIDAAQSEQTEEAA